MILLHCEEESEWVRKRRFEKNLPVAPSAAAARAAAARVTTGSFKWKNLSYFEKKFCQKAMFFAPKFCSKFNVLEVLFVRAAVKDRLSSDAGNHFRAQKVGAEQYRCNYQCFHFSSS